jgi:hypothetical protein
VGLARRSSTSRSRARWRVGNVNSLQLIACVGFVALARRRLQSRTRAGALAGAVLLALLVAFALYSSPT